MLSDGSVRNAYNVRIYNNTLQPRSYALGVLGLDDAEIRMVSGVDPNGNGTVGVDASANRVVRVLVSGFADAVVPLEFVVVDADTGAEARTNDLFSVLGR